jgi:hypothetical protein
MEQKGRHALNCVDNATALRVTETTGVTRIGNTVIEDTGRRSSLEESMNQLKHYVHEMLLYLRRDNRKKIELHRLLGSN